MFYSHGDRLPKENRNERYDKYYIYSYPVPLYNILSPARGFADTVMFCKDKCQSGDQMKAYDNSDWHLYAYSTHLRHMELVSSFYIVGCKIFLVWFLGHSTLYVEHYQSWSVNKLAALKLPIYTKFVASSYHFCCQLGSVASICLLNHFFLSNYNFSWRFRIVPVLLTSKSRTFLR